MLYCTEFMDYQIKSTLGNTEWEKGISPLVKLLLNNRDVQDTFSDFSNPNFETGIHDPLTISGMNRVVDRIIRALNANEHIAIYSDYDCDGIPGATVFSDFFRKINYENVSFYIPHRHKEGYGLNTTAIDSLKEKGVTLMITVDLGITNIKEVDYAKSLDIDVIVTDHHLPHVEMVDGKEIQVLPKAFEVINTKKTNETYKETMLCGCATVWKVVCALIVTIKNKTEERNKIEQTIFDIPTGWEKWSLDMVALSTIADMVPLVGENRVLAYYGLKVLKKSKRPGLKALLAKARANQESLTEDDVAFTIAPRLNAASRMDTPETAFKLLSTENYSEAEELAKTLDSLNTTRKENVSSIMKEVYKDLKKQESQNELPHVIVVGNPLWSPGILGLIASKILDAYHKPVFVWGKAEEENQFKGSCRSDGSVNLVDLMLGVQENIFAHSGGHELAGGFSVFKEHIHFLENHLNDSYNVVKKNEYVPAKNIFIDCELPLSYVNYKTMDDIDTLAPYGVGNQKPTFIFRDLEVVEVRHFGKEQNHLELRLKKVDGEVKAYGYFIGVHSFEKNVGVIEVGKYVSVIGQLERDMFGSRKNIKIRIVDIL